MKYLKARQHGELNALCQQIVTQLKPGTIFEIYILPNSIKKMEAMFENHFKLKMEYDLTFGGTLRINKLVPIK